MRAEGLDDEFDALITALPRSLMEPGDAPLMVDHPALDRDPYGVLGRLRDEHGPVLQRGDDGTYFGVEVPNSWGQSEEHPQFLVLGWEPHIAVVRNPEAFRSGEGAAGPYPDAIGDIVTFLDGDDHDGHRQLLNMAWNRGAIGQLHAEVIEPIARFLVRRLARRIRAGEPVCFGKDLGMPMSYKTITSFLGLPHDRFASFVELGAALHNTASRPEDGMRAAVELTALWTEELDKRRAEPRDDLLTWMAEASTDRGISFDDEEVIRYARIFLPSGIETTSRQIALMGVALLSHPEQYQLLTENPDLVDSALEEVMRWSPSAMQVARRCVEDTEVAGVAIPRLSSLSNWTSIANRDPARWPDPDRFDITRDHRINVAFNTGVHHCLGINLARAELKAILVACLEELPDLALAVEPADLDVRGCFVRSVLHVPVEVR